MSDRLSNPKKLITMRFEPSQLEEIDHCVLKMFQYSGVKMDRTKLARIMLEIAVECQPHLDHAMVLKGVLRQNPYWSSPWSFATN